MSRFNFADVMAEVDAPIGVSFDALMAEVDGATPGLSPGSSPGIVPAGMPGMAQTIPTPQGVGPAPAQTWYWDIGAGLQTGVGQAVSQVGGAMEAAGNILPGSMGRSLQRAGSQTVQMGMDDASQFPQPQTRAGQLAQSIPGMAASVGAGLLTGGAGGVLMGAGVAGAQGGGQQYNEAKARVLAAGGSQQQARDIATREAGPMGLFSAATSTIPMGRYLNRFAPGVLQKAGGKVMSTTAGKLLGDAAAEGSQEAAEELASMTLQRIAEDDPQAFQQWGTRLATAGAGGAILGGGTGAALHGVGGMMGGANEVQDAQLPAPSPVAQAGDVEAPAPVAAAAPVVGAGPVGEAVAGAPVSVLSDPNATEEQVLAALAELDGGVPTPDATQSVDPAVQATPEPQAAPAPEAAPEVPFVAASPNPTADALTAKPQPIHAITTKDGRVLSDPSAMAHFQVADKYGVPYEDVADSGWVVGDKYESSDGFYKPSQQTQDTYNAKRAERSSSPEPTDLAGWKAEASRLGLSPQGPLPIVRARVRRATAEIQRQSSVPIDTPRTETPRTDGPQAIQGDALQVSRISDKTAEAGSSSEQSLARQQSIPSPTVLTRPQLVAEARRLGLDVRGSAKVLRERVEAARSAETQGQDVQPKTSSGLTSARLGVRTSGSDQTASVEEQKSGDRQASETVPAPDGRDAWQMTANEFRKSAKWFHGTSREAAAKIQAEGFKPATGYLAGDRPQRNIGPNEGESVWAGDRQIAARYAVTPPDWAPTTDGPHKGASRKGGIVPLALSPSAKEGSDYRIVKEHGRDVLEVLNPSVIQTHKSIVEQAIRDGKPVPPSVLADYPDLAAEAHALAAKVSPEQSRSGGSRSRGQTKPATPDTPRPASPGVVGENTSADVSQSMLESLRELDSKSNGRGYVPDAITPAKIAELKRVGLVQGPPRKPRITESGRRALYDFVQTERSAMMKSGADFDRRQLELANAIDRGDVVDRADVEAHFGEDSDFRARAKYASPGVEKGSTSGSPVSADRRRGRGTSTESGNPQTASKSSARESTLGTQQSSPVAESAQDSASRSGADTYGTATQSASSPQAVGQVGSRPKGSDPRRRGAATLPHDIAQAVDAGMKIVVAGGHKSIAAINRIARQVAAKLNIKGKWRAVAQALRDAAAEFFSTRMDRSRAGMAAVPGGNSGAFSRHDPRISGHAINPIEETLDIARRVSAKRAANRARDLAKIEQRGADNAKAEAERLQKGKESAELTAKAYQQRVRDQQRASRQMVGIEQRGAEQTSRRLVKAETQLEEAGIAIEGMKAKLRATIAENAKDKNLREIMRARVTELAKDYLPADLQGRMLVPVRDAKNAADVFRAIFKIEDVLLDRAQRNTVRLFKATSSTGMLKKLTDARRTQAKGIIAAAQADVEAIGKQGATADERRTALEALREKVQQLQTIYHEHRFENKIRVKGQWVDLAQKVRQLGLNLTFTAKRRGRDRRRPERLDNGIWQKTQNAGRTVLTPEAAMMRLDGEFNTGDVATDIGYTQLADANLAFRDEHGEYLNALDQLAMDLGFDGVTDVLSRLGGRLGDATREKIDFKVQGVPLSLGQALDLYAASLDPETGALIPKGQRWAFRDGDEPFDLTPAQVSEIIGQIDDRYLQFHQRANGMLEAHFPDIQKAHWTIKGYEPPGVPNHWPRRRDTTQIPVDAKQNPAAEVDFYMENAGGLKTRKQSPNVPLFVDDYATTLMQKAEFTFRAKHLMVPLYNARRLLEAPEVTTAIRTRFGKNMVDNIHEYMQDVAGVRRLSPWQETLAQWTRNYSRSLTQISPSSWAIQLSGIPRIAMERGGAEIVAKGLGGAFSPSTHRDMVQNSSWARTRYKTDPGALSGGLAQNTQQTASNARTAARAGWKSAKAAASSAASLKLRDAGAHSWDVLDKSIPALTDKVQVSQWFDGVVSRVAWSGLRSIAAANGHDTAWVDKQHRTLMRRIANSGEPTEMAFWAAEVNRKGLTPLTAFTSDASKAAAQVYRAMHGTKADKARALSGLLASAAFAGVMKGLWDAGMGALRDDEDAEDKAYTKAVDRFTDELASLVPFADKVKDMVAGTARFNQRLIDAPLIGGIENATRSVARIANEGRKWAEGSDEADMDKALDAAFDLLTEIVRTRGIPTTPITDARKLMEAQ